MYPLTKFLLINDVKLLFTITLIILILNLNYIYLQNMKTMNAWEYKVIITNETVRKIIS